MAHQLIENRDPDDALFLAIRNAVKAASEAHSSVVQAVFEAVKPFTLPRVNLTPLPPEGEL